jgi:hypothetical protein
MDAEAAAFLVDEETTTGEVLGPQETMKMAAPTIMDPLLEEQSKI